MLAPVLTEYRKVEMLEHPAPVSTAGSVIVKVGYASICGSDQHVWNGDFHPRTKLPFVQGHEFAGEIMEVGKGVKRFKAGDRVAVDPIFWCGKCAACAKGHFPACASLKLLGIDVDGGFAPYVSAQEHMLFKVPNNVDDRIAALVEVFSIGFHACNRAGLANDDTAVIFGAGKIGQVILQAAMNRTNGDLYIVDILPERLAIARKSCPRVKTINASECDPVAAIKDLTNGRGTDVAFEAVGHYRTAISELSPVRQAVQTIRQGGTVCVLGLADDPVPLVLKELIWKEAKIVASRVTHGEFAESIDHLSKGLLNPNPLVTDIITADKIQEAFLLLEREPEKHLKILVKH
ncbi:MAG: alcohol dehydrogenase catalytic domain-containing protein [Fibrobacteres bacterium]|nr:alcohol dehydrogenase catalytic domain-containing protein [Fibrobacterota bacterium]